VKEAAGPSCAVVPVLHLKDGHTKRAVISILHSFLRNKPFGQEFPARRYLQVNGPEGGALGPGGERGGEGERDLQHRDQQEPTGGGLTVPALDLEDRRGRYHDDQHHRPGPRGEGVTMTTESQP
jgi:hypothetical protein